jgi:hypothetical protein
LEEHVTSIFRVKEFMLASCLAYIFTLMKESTCSSKISTDFEHTAQHYIPKDKLFNISAIHHKPQQVHENNFRET